MNKMSVYRKKSLTAPWLLFGDAGDATDILYATGIMAPGAAFLLESGVRRALIVSPLEYGRARRCAGRRAEVFMPQDFFGDRRVKLCEWALALAQRGGVRAVRVRPNFPVGLVEALRRRGLKITVDPAEVYEQRMVKSGGERAAIRRAQQAAVAAMKRAVAVLRQSRPDARGVLRYGNRVLTSEALRATIDGALLEGGYIAEGTIVACGDAAAQPHARGEGPLRAHETIVMDIFPRDRVSGYWGDLTRTVVRGRAHPDVARAFVAVRMAQRAALNTLRAGAAAAAVHTAAAQALEKRGWATKTGGGRAEGFIHSTGHGVGLDIHEAPALSLYSQATLKAGMVVTVEPGLYYAGMGGVRMEDTVVITRHGFEVLARCPYWFEL